MPASNIELGIPKRDSYSGFDQKSASSFVVYNDQEVNPATGVHTIRAQTISEYFSSLDKSNKIFKAIEAFLEISQKSGDEIKLLKKYGYLPVIIDKDREPFPLYSFIEVLDGLIEYDEILDEIPSITLAQVQNTITFLRKLTSINIYNADIDEIEDDSDINSPDFVENIINAATDGGVKRVLYHDK